MPDWCSLAVHRWCTFAVNRWCTFAVNYWCIIGHKLTPILAIEGSSLFAAV